MATRRPTPWLAASALLLLPAASAAQQLDYGVKSAVAWTDNVYGTSDDARVGGVDEDPVDDYSLRISPWGVVSDPDGDLTWSLRYAPSWESYLQESDIDGLDHVARGSVAWRMTERTTVSLSDSFQKYNSAVRFNENADSPTEQVDYGVRQQELTGNATSLSLRHLLTRRDVVSLYSSFNLLDYKDQEGGDSHTFVTGANYLHSLTEHTRVGASAAWTQQTFERGFAEDSVTNYYNLSADLEHAFSRTLRLEASVGPTIIDSNNELATFAPPFGVRIGSAGGALAFLAENCETLDPAQPAGPSNPFVSGVANNFAGCAGPPPFTPLTPEEAKILGVNGAGSGSPSRSFVQFDASDLVRQNGSGALVSLDDSDVGGTTLTYFARLALLKEWELWQAELAYVRSNNEAGSFGVSSVQDSFQASLNWHPAPLWSLFLTGAYTIQDQANDVVVPTGVILVNQAAPAGVTSVSQIATVQQVLAEVSDNAVSYSTASVAFTATRQLTRHASAFFSVYWYTQNQKLDAGNASQLSDDERVTRWNTLTFWVGLDWQFDTIRF